MFKALNAFTVQIEKPLKDTIEVGSLELYVDPSFDKTKYTNRIGTVIAEPRGNKSEIKVGYEVLVVHTILMYQVYKGVKKDPPELMDKEEGLYSVKNNLIIMYRESKDHEWKCNSIFVLVKPIKAEKEDYVVGSLTLPDSYFKTDISCNSHGYIEQYGHVHYMNPELEDQGVTKGDKVFFKDFGNYEFNLDGEIYYCMDNKDLLAIIE